MGGDEFERAVVIIMDSFVSEGFICTAHGDVVAVLVPADIYFVTRHAIEVRERAFNGLAVDICPVHESYFQFESKKCSNPIVVYGQAPFGRELPTALAIQAFAINLRRHPNAPDGLPHFVNNRS